MELNFITDYRIAEDASYQVLEHHEIDGLYGVYDLLAGLVIFDGYDYDEVIEFACSRNSGWEAFLTDLIG